MSPPSTRRPAGTAAPEDEAALVARLRGGDRAAYAALVDRHAGPLLRFAQTIAKGRAIAEEVVQETWLAVLDDLGGFEGRSSLRTWLFRIAANKARTRAVREGRSVPFSALSGGEAGEEGTADDLPFDSGGAWRATPGSWSEEDPERLALAAETGAAIAAAIAALPEGQRAVITLRDLEGLETEEICSLLGLSVTNQRVLLHRARVRVRAVLEAHLAGGR